MDWPVLIRAGLGELRLRPSEFWALTPAELALMLGRSEAGRPMARAQFDKLCLSYPDAGHEEIQNADAT